MISSSSLPARQVRRARIVLLSADGVAKHQIAERAGVSRPIVDKWRRRYVRDGIAGLSDRDRPGRPARLDQSKIITAR